MSDIFIESAHFLPESKYVYINREEDARRAMEKISKYNIIEVDTEGTSLNPYEGKVSLFQIGLPNEAFVFDNRSDTEHSDFNIELFKPILQDRNILKILQNAVYDMKMIKCNHGFYIENIYDTMLVEQLLHLGLYESVSMAFKMTSLKSIINRRLGLEMEKEPRNTFADYNQTFQPFQLRYAATDVTVLRLIRDLQLLDIVKHGLEDAVRLECEFTKPMCEMELNGIILNVDRQREILYDMELEAKKHSGVVSSLLNEAIDQTTLFDISMVNIDSNVQLKKALQRFGLSLDNTNIKTLSKYRGIPVIDSLLDYRKAQKFISTYGESLINKISSITGRLHTDFMQMVSTGRLSSRDPNLQNIPKKQKYRSCFQTRPGYKLITCDMSSAELRILGNLSQDPIFLECYAKGIDLHRRTAAEINGVSLEEVTSTMRGDAKAINFGLVYGLSKFGLSRNLGISEQAADSMITKYFQRYQGVKKYLDSAAKNAVKYRYSRTISGRKRFYTIPKWDDPNKDTIIRAVERAAMNAGVQGSLSFNSKIKGLGNIGDQLNEKVQLETGFGTDSAVGVYSGNKEVYDLCLSNGISLKITLNHEIPTVNRVSEKELVKDVAVGNLTDNDLIMIPLDVSKGVRTVFDRFDYTGNGKIFDIPKYMTAELSFIIGCLIGDGSYTKHNHFRFVCPSSRIELFEKFNLCVYKVFNYKPIIKYAHKNDDNRKKLPYSQVSSVFIREFLKHIGLDYVKHHDKAIPEYFYTETLENRGALLNGLFSTDGGMHFRSGPGFTTVSKQVADMVHQILFTLGINSNLKTYKGKNGNVYRLQIHKRFNEKFKKYVGFSVKNKQEMLDNNCEIPKFGDGSIVPKFIPKTIERVLRKVPDFKTVFSYHEQAHLRRFKKGCCSFNSWRRFYERMPDCAEKKQLSQYLNFDFCTIKSLIFHGKEDTYDLICNNIHYFIANGVVVHNSNADTIKQSMIYLVDRLEKSGYDARLILTVHDETVTECREDQVDEVRHIVEQATIEGFGRYFSIIPMEAESLVGPCWLKGKCENKINDKTCDSSEMIFDSEGALRCKNCGAIQ